jgi:peptidyl-dipeptidase A
MRSTSLALIALIFVAGCASGTSGNSAPTAADAKKFMEDVNETTFKLALDSGQAGWISETYITDDSSAVAARSNQRIIDKSAQYALESKGRRRAHKNSRKSRRHLRQGEVVRRPEEA